MRTRKYDRAPPLPTFLRLLFMTVCLVSLATNAVAENPPEGDPIRGATQWVNNCDRCHEMRDPHEFRDDIWRPIVGHMRIRAGLTGQQARNILAFLRSANYTAPIASRASPRLGAVPGGEVVDGETAYSQTCVACHGADGRGVLPGVPDMTAAAGPFAKSDEVLLDHIIDGFQTPGSPMAMPSRGGNPQLSDADLSAVLDYMKEAFAR